MTEQDEKLGHRRWMWWLFVVAMAAAIGPPVFTGVRDYLNDTEALGLIEQLGSKDKATARQAEDALVAMGPRAVPSLIRIMVNPARRYGYDMQSHRVKPVLERIGVAAVPAFIDLLDDPDRDVRAHAARGLLYLGPQAIEAAPALCAVLADEDVNIRRTARYALVGMGPEIIPQLIDVLRQDNLAAKSQAAEALSDFGSVASDAVPALIEVVESNPKDKYLYGNAVHALGTMGSAAKEVLPLLRKTIEGRELTFREAEILLALARLAPHDGETINTLTAALACPDGSVRRAAIRGFGEIGPDAIAFAPELIRLIGSDTYQMNRADAAIALVRVKPDGKDVIAVLIKALRDGSSYVRRAAADALGEMGPAAKEAIPAITEVLQDENDEAGYAAAKALAKIKRPQ
jgi:HEAT repeat protein